MEITLEAKAREWLAAKGWRALAVRYEAKRCCGGGKICLVRVEEQKGNGRESDVRWQLPGGMEVSIDARAARRLPARFVLGLRGWGRFRHLEPALSGEQWGALLYD